MKNTLKMLGIICIIAAAIFITSCGPGVEADPSVTFDANGGTLNGPSKVTVKSGETVAEPTAPKAPAAGSGSEPTTAGFWKLGAASSEPPTFKEWQLNGAKYDFSTPVTADITLKAAWNYGSGGEATKLDDKLVAADGDLLSQVVAYLNKTATPTTANDKYLLVVGTSFNTTKQIVMEKGNLKITKVTPGGDRTITGFTPTGTNTANSHVAFIIGPATPPASIASAPTLTINSVGLRGNCEIKENPDGTADLTGAGVGDSLVRVRNGAKLILDEGSSVKGHKNNVANTSGTTGNGSAVCVVDGAALTMMQGSVIEHNESSATSTNKNLVGGVYTIITNTATGDYKTVTLDIQGGQINNNKSAKNTDGTDNGQTKDVYATEGGVFKLSGNVKISEITLNADPATNTVYTYTTMEIYNLGPAADVNLSLRTTTAANAAAVGALWKDKTVLTGPKPSTGSAPAVDSTYVGKFHLKDFKWNGGNAAIDTAQTTGYKLSNDGKFVENK